MDKFASLLKLVPPEERQEIIEGIYEMSKQDNDIVIKKTTFGKTIDFETFESYIKALKYIILKQPLILTSKDIKIGGSKFSSFAEYIVTLKDQDLICTCLDLDSSIVLNKVSNVYTDDNTPNYFLHVCAMLRLEKVLNKALEERLGVVANLIDKNGNTCLHIAASNELFNVCKKALEMKHELAKIKNVNGNTFVKLSFNSYSLEICKKALEVDPTILEVQDENGVTVLHDIISNPLSFSDKMDFVKDAIEKNTKLAKIQDRFNRQTPIHYLAMFGTKVDNEICKTAIELLPEIIYIQDDNGKTVLDLMKDKDFAKECYTLAKQSLIKKFEMEK